MANQFDIKQAVAAVPQGLAFWMALSCLKNAAPTFYNFNKDRFHQLDAICNQLQTIATEMKEEKAAREKAKADMIEMTRKTEEARKAGSK